MTHGLFFFLQSTIQVYLREKYETFLCSACGLWYTHVAQFTYKVNDRAHLARKVYAK